MSVLKYLPYPLIGWVALVALAVIALAFGVVRMKSGILQHWPPIAGAAVVLVAIGALVVFSHRPAFLTAPTPPANVSSVAEFERFAATMIESGDPPGFSVVVVKDGEIVYANGFGQADAPRDIPATAEATYRWWSITKMFTAVAILQLEEQGLLELDAPVTRYLPSFDVEYPSATSKPVTIRHLLTHTSGLRDAGMDILGWIHFDGDPALNQTEFLADTLPSYRKLIAEPGTEGHYTNIGYMVLSAVIEAVAGQDYEDYVTEHVLRPLGMDHTGFDYAASDSANQAAGSHPVDAMTVPVAFVIDLDRAVRERAQGRLWFNHVYPHQTAPSGLLGSPRDMARFMIAMLNEGSIDGTQLLTPASVAAMNVRYIDVSTSPAPIPGFGFGFGWFQLDQDGRVSVTHGGQGTGTASMVRLYPEEDLGIFVVANSTYLGRNFGHDVVNALASIPWGAPGPGD